jgi:hypothetical protein
MDNMAYTTAFAHTGTALSNMVKGHRTNRKATKVCTMGSFILKVQPSFFNNVTSTSVCFSLSTYSTNICPNINHLHACVLLDKPESLLRKTQSL